MGNLKNNLRELLQKNNLSIAEAERQAGLRMSALRNIMRDQSKNPSVENLNKLATLFQCSITDLICEEPPSKREGTLKTIENFDILVEYANLVQKLVKENNFNLSFTQYSKIQKECYYYTIENNLSELDKNFTKWFLLKELELCIKEK